MNRHYEYSNVEYLAMVHLYALSGKNMQEARRRYAAPEHLQSLRMQGILSPQVPSAPTFLAVTQRLLEFGQFRAPTHATGQGRPPVHSVELEEELVKYFEEDPTRSTRMAARQFNVSQYYVYKVLNSKLYPYHIRHAHPIFGDDPKHRMRFSQWILNNRNRNILWTDEATFTCVGLFNIHNEHYWDLNNPQVTHEHSHQMGFTVNVWAGIINDCLIGPIFIEGNLIGVSYLEILKTVIPDLLDEVPLAYLKNLYYQHNGCPAHLERAVCVHLNNVFGDRWIGRSGPIHWPARSSDLTPLDFYLWSAIKQLVYTEEAQSREQLKVAIVDAFNMIKGDRDTLSKLKDNLIERAGMCVQVNGKHFEQLL